MLSFLGGGRCESVKIDDLRLDSGELEVEMNKQMNGMRKKVALRLCLCYWTRVRKDLLIECRNDEIENQVDACIARITDPQGRMDFWQRYLDVNRFLFSLNAHLFSERYKLHFSSISQQFAELTDKQTYSLLLANQTLTSTSEIVVLTKKLEEKLSLLSERLSPLSDLTTHLFELVEKSTLVMHLLAETSTDIKDTIRLLFLTAFYFVCYLLIYIFTAFIFPSSFFTWLRRILFMAFLIDWFLLNSQPLHSLICLLSTIPLALLSTIAMFFYRRRIQQLESQEEKAITSQSEEEEEHLMEWLKAFIQRRSVDAKALEHMDQLKLELEEISNDSMDGRTEPAESENECPKLSAFSTPKSSKSRRRGLQSPRGKRSKALK